MKKFIAKSTSSLLVPSATETTTAWDPKPKAEDDTFRCVPKGPFKVLTIPKSWSDSLHAAQAKTASNIKEAADKSRLAVDETLGRWKQHIPTARTTWSRLTEDELLKCGGQVAKLAALIQERYAIVRAEAHRQIKVFVDKLKH